MSRIIRVFVNSRSQTPPRRAIVLESLLQPARLPQGSFVFGHYYPVKYIGAIDRINAEDYCLITFLRNPTERLVSHYAFWKSRDISDHFLWREMTSENWSFRQFALSPEMKISMANT